MSTSTMSNGLPDNAYLLPQARQDLLGLDRRAQAKCMWITIQPVGGWIPQTSASPNLAVYSRHRDHSQPLHTSTQPRESECFSNSPTVSSIALLELPHAGKTVPNRRRLSSR
jgi:hypothetical protein